MLITYPLFTVTDDSGAVVTGATVAITSVKDLDGADVASPGATVHQSGANVAVTYDAEAKGEAWVVLAVSKVGSTFTGLNAAPGFYLSRDPSRIESAIGAGGKVALDLSQTGLSPRDLGSVADSALTVGDALVCAVAGAAGKESVSGTSYVIKTPSTGTVIRTFTLDSPTAPTSRT